MQRYTHGSALAGPWVVAPASRQPEQWHGTNQHSSSGAAGSGLRARKTYMSAEPAMALKSRSRASRIALLVGSHPPPVAECAPYVAAVAPKRPSVVVVVTRPCHVAQPRRPSAASRTIREEGPVSYTFVYWAVLQSILCSRDQYREERPLIPGNPKRKLKKSFTFLM